MMRLKVAVICALLVAIDAQNSVEIPTVDEMIKQLKSGELMPTDVVNMMPILGLTDMLDLKLNLEDKLLQQVMASLQDAGDLPSVDDLIEQLISGYLSQKDVVNMTPRMQRQYLVDVLHKLHEKLLPHITEYMNSLPAAAPDAWDLPSADELVEHLISGNLSQKEITKMTSKMSRQYLLDVLHSLPKELLQQVPEIVEADPSATSEIIVELNQHQLMIHRLLVGCVVGCVLSLAAVLVVAALLLLVRRRRCSQQSAADQPPAMEKLAADLADRHLTMGGDDKRPCTTSCVSPLGSARPSVDSNQYEPVKEDLLLPPVAYHELNEIRQTQQENEEIQRAAEYTMRGWSPEARSHPLYGGFSSRVYGTGTSTASDGTPATNSSAESNNSEHHATRNWPAEERDLQIQRTSEAAPGAQRGESLPAPQPAQLSPAQHTSPKKTRSGRLY